jgi:hypothetical protein
LCACNTCKKSCKCLFFLSVAEEEEEEEEEEDGKRNEKHLHYKF